MLDPRAAGAKRLKDRVAIITGSGQGIGRATARRMAEEGAIIMVCDRNHQGAERTRDELRDYGTTAEMHVDDVSQPDSAKALMAAAKERFDHIDILVNNAGGSMHGPKLGWEYTPEEILANVQNNFFTTMWCCWAVLPYMVAQRSGAIVNLGSNAPQGTMRLPYAASKGGVFAITTSLALETAELGVRINCVAPHWSVSEDPSDALVTRIPGQAISRRLEEQAEFRQRLAEQHLRNIPMRRPGLKEEQAAAIVFLASDDASFITGQILSVGGGARAF
ncbi:MAG TPA: SDR family NAD(P)-dependent oxidoreductase [Chloroflexota bacterium]|nr:SDR family NAD(P)-dependent oxidoreductase [Chloroflexota bacterium]